MTNPIVIGIDAGGTMTDTILVDERGHFKIGKAATTPRNEADGFIASAEDAADAWGISLEELFSGVNVVLYSGTGMLNTLLSRTGRRLGLITTKGLEDMLDEDEEGYPVANIEATKRHRAEMRAKRLAQARPVAEWIASERSRVEKADFAPEVTKMYASAIKLSSRFTREFSDFWNVDAKSIFMPGAKP